VSSPASSAAFDQSAPAGQPGPDPSAVGPTEAVRDIGEVPAVEVITTTAVHLMSAAAVKLGLAEDGERYLDLDEARKLITALAGLVVAGAPEIGGAHAAPLRDGLRSLQLAFREASSHPDAPGEGPGERLTGAVHGAGPVSAGRTRAARRPARS
jgi:hypothetical protein